MRFIVTLTSKGQLTLPVALRAKWGLEDGDKIDLYFDEKSRTAQILPRNKKLSDLKGFFHEKPSGGTAASQEDIDAAIAEQVIEDQKRITWQNSKSPKKSKPKAAE
jgi:bifunctional DNA-binding transcriptional regulator/antitoxin component of YhaV-PrlF toxin-antitoxin module